MSEEYRTEWNIDNHIVGKVYTLDQQNMNAMLSDIVWLLKQNADLKKENTRLLKMSVDMSTRYNTAMGELAMMTGLAEGRLATIDDLHNEIDAIKSSHAMYITQNLEPKIHELEDKLEDCLTIITYYSSKSKPTDTEVVIDNFDQPVVHYGTLARNFLAAYYEEMDEYED